MNPYFNMYNSQLSFDRINEQINQLESMKKQMQQQTMSQPTNLTQNFQITPNNTYNMRYANSLDEVTKNIVYVETPFFSNDMSVVWIKNAKGDIKTYELNEIVPKDEKDIMIENLQMQVNEMKGMIENAKSNESDNAKHNEYVADTTKEIKSSGTANVSKFKGKSK